MLIAQVFHEVRFSFSGKTIRFANISTVNYPGLGNFYLKGRLGQTDPWSSIIHFSNIKTEKPRFQSEHRG